VAGKGLTMLIDDLSPPNSSQHTFPAKTSTPIALQTTFQETPNSKLSSTLIWQNVWLTMVPPSNSHDTTSRLINDGSGQPCSKNDSRPTATTKATGQLMQAIMAPTCLYPIIAPPIRFLTILSQQQQ